MRKTHRRTIRTLRNLMVPNTQGHQGLAKLLDASNVTVEDVSLEDMIASAVVGKALPGMDVPVEEILPSPVDVVRQLDGNYRITLMRGYAVAPDPARWASSLSRRLQTGSKFLGIVTALVADYEADGHGFLSTESAQHLGVEILFQATGYVLGMAGQEIHLHYGSPVVKGMIKVDIDHPHLELSKIDKDVDMVINKNMLKGLSVPVGTKLNVALFEQAKSAESDHIIDLTLPWQFMTRAADLLSESAWAYLEKHIRAEFKRPISLVGEFMDDNPFQTTLVRSMDLGIIPRIEDLKARFVSLAQNFYKVHVPGFVIRLLTCPQVPDGKISLPGSFRRHLKVGDRITVIRLPFLGTEVEVLEVVDFKGCGVKDASIFTGDSDGDMLFCILGEFVDQAKVNARRAILRKFVPVLESSVSATGLNGFEASMRAAVSKAQIGLRDSQITQSVFKSGGVFGEEWALLMKAAQDAVDFCKKDIPGIQLISRIPGGAPRLYRALNGRVRTFNEWVAALNDGRKKLYRRVPGPVGRLMNLVLESIPTPIFREFGAEYNTQYYPKDGMRVWTRILHSATPAFLAKVERVVRRYRISAKLIAHGNLDRGLRSLDALSSDLNLDPKGIHVADFIALNILCGNPLKLIGNAKILTWLPVSKDILHYYNWLRKSTLNTGEWEHFEPDYGYRSVKWNLR